MRNWNNSTETSLFPVLEGVLCFILAIIVVFALASFFV